MEDICFLNKPRARRPRSQRHPHIFLLQQLEYLIKRDRVVIIVLWHGITITALLNQRSTFYGVALPILSCVAFLYALLE